MKRKAYFSFFAFAISSLLLFSGVSVLFAYSEQEQISATQAQIDDIKAQQSEINSNISELSSDAEVAKQQINEINLQIQDVERKVTALNTSITELEAEIEKRDEIIKSRMVAVQEVGGRQTYLEVIFGATSFGNFIERTNTISAFIQSDLEIIAEQKAAIEELEVAKAELEVIQTDLNATKAQLEAEQAKLQAELSKQKAAAEELAVDLAEKEKIKQEQEAALEKAADEIANGGGGNGSGSGSRPPANGDYSDQPLSPETLQYAGIVEQECAKNGIPEHADVILAIIEQESGGKGGDVMQCSECIGLPPNSITDPAYSIEVGVDYFAYNLGKAYGDVEIALQAYNYGEAYIDYALDCGGYSLENAYAYSEYMADKMGWSGYGNPEYVPQVQRYY